MAVDLNKGMDYYERELQSKPGQVWRDPGVIREVAPFFSLSSPPPGEFPSSPAGAVIEIIERTDDPDPLVIVPNEVRINGQKLLTAEGYPVTVHEVSTKARELVLVTLTLIARRVTFDSEPKSTGG